jgi:hypothetical protein
VESTLAEVVFGRKPALRAAGFEDEDDDEDENEAFLRLQDLEFGAFGVKRFGSKR